MVPRYPVHSAGVPGYLGTCVRGYLDLGACAWAPGYHNAITKITPNDITKYRLKVPFNIPFLVCMK